jgi:serine/threonine protein kinase
MASTSAPVRPGALDLAAAGLAPGAVVGGRFEIERAVGEDALGTLLAAKDQKTKRPISVRVLAPGLIATPQAIEKLRAEVKTAAGIQHKNVVATYGMGADKGGARYVASEWVEGRTLAQVIEEKKAGAQPMSLRGAYNVVAHVCKALEAARSKGTAHGALRPSVVFVSKAGRVKVANLGIDRAVVETAGPAALGPGEQAFLAPEVKSGAPATSASDVFGLGGLLYAMLTGRSPLDDFVAPSQAHPEATAEVDQVLLRCLSADPAARFATAHDVQQALVKLTAQAQPSQDADDFGVHIDLDVDIGSVPPPGGDASAPVSVPRAAAIPRAASTGAARPSAPKPSAPKPSAPQGALPKPSAPQGAGPQVGARVSINESFRADGPVVAAPALSAEVDLSNLLSKITENDAPRWMVVKDNLDHGPFSGRELVNLVLKGDIQGDHGLLNMDTGERRKVGESPEFSEFVAQFKLKKAEQDHKVALDRSAKVETASMFTKVAILGGVIAAVAAGVGIFLVTRPDVQEETRSDAELADLYERGEIEITGSAGILPDPPAGSGRRRRRNGAGGSSYEDAMNQVVNLGDVSGGSGSQARLSPQDVAGIMNRNINRLVPCLSQGSGGGQVRIDMAIGGDGHVLGATVRNGTPAFQQCVAGRVRQIRFPSFSAPRMGASYTFSAN